MAESYRILEGRLLKLKSQYYKKYLRRKFLFALTQVFFTGITVAGSGFVTWLIYQSCVNPIVEEDGVYQFTMTECITTGALFATFGSAIIAVLTLYTSRYLTNYHETLQTLMLDLVPEYSEGIVKRRWAFIPRVSRTRFAGEVQFFGIESIQVQFQIGDFQQMFPLPTTEADFKDLPLLSNYLCMKCMRKKYFTRLAAKGLIEEYPAWDCVMAIYRNILLYKASCLLVWIGACFVLQSILFTFFYSTLYHFFVA